MKIIHIIPSIGIEASGPSHSVKGLCDSLIDMGSEVTISSVDVTNKLKPYVKEEKGNYKKGLQGDAEINKIFSMGFGPERMLRSPELFSWLKSECKNNKNTILHNHGMWYFMALYPSRLNNLSGVKLIQSPRGALSEYSLTSGSRLKPLFWNIFQKRALSKANCFHATSESEYRDIRALGFKQPVAIVPNGVHIPVVPAKKNKSDNNVLTYLGRIHPEKGIEELLISWKEIQNHFKNWRLQIIGAGNQQDIIDFEGKALELKLDRIDFFGPMYDDKKWEAYTKSDLFVLPSPSENFGMTVAESLACGTPVITTNGTPWSKLESKGAGWYIDIGSEALVQGLKNAMSLKPETLSEMGERGRLWMNEEFSWHQIGKEMIDVYNWLIDQKIDPPKCIRMD